jgi:hypothetical protein
MNFEEIEGVGAAGCPCGGQPTEVPLSNALGLVDSHDVVTKSEDA